MLRGSELATDWLVPRCVPERLRAVGRCGRGWTYPGGSDFVHAYSISGAQTSVSAPAGSCHGCVMNRAHSPVNGGKVTVGMKPVRVD